MRPAFIRAYSFVLVNSIDVRFILQVMDLISLLFNGGSRGRTVSGDYHGQSHRTFPLFGGESGMEPAARPATPQSVRMAG